MWMLDHRDCYQQIQSHPSAIFPSGSSRTIAQMLRAYVVMGAGNLAEEMVRLAAMLTGG